MSKHIGTLLRYFSVAALATLISFVSPGIPPAAGAGCGGNVPMAAISAGPCANPSSGLVNGRVSKAYGRLPLYFIANRGQVDSRASFYETGPGHAIFFTQKGIVLRLSKGDRKARPLVHGAAKGRALHGKSDAESLAAVHSSYLGVRMLGMNKNVKIVPENAQPAKVNYFIGNDPRKWRSSIPTYGAILYKDAYPGIDVKFYGNNRMLEYDIIVKPGADPSKVRFQYSGAGDVRVTAAGDLAIDLNGGRLVFRKPDIYQKLNGGIVSRQGRFEVRRDRPASGLSSESAKMSAFTCRFELGAYDRKSPLVIDPALVYSTFLGGTGVDEAYGIAVDGSGNAYITGITNSTDLPAGNGLQSSFGGSTTDYDGFVAKIAAGGRSLVYLTYLGGSGSSIAYSIALDGSGNAYVTGWTDSPDFPLQKALQAYNGGGSDAFVAEISAAGTSLVYSTYLGGTEDDWGDHIAVDSSGNAYVTGATYSTDFPTRNALYSSLAGTGGEDAFVTEIAAGGQSLVYSTYLGGSGNDEGWAIAVDSSGNAYVAGLTVSSDFPTQNPIQAGYAGGNNYTDAFVSEIAAGGQSLVYSTYLGGSNNDEAYGIAVDSSGNAYVTGSTLSTDFPTKNPFQPQNVSTTNNGDAFVAEIAAGGTGLVYSTYLGGSQDNWGNCIAVDGSGNAYVAGETDSTDFPVANGLQSSNGGGYDAFVSEIATGGQSLVYSTYLGGSSDDEAYGIALDNSGNAYVAGVTESSGFPTVNALQPTNAGGGGDAFIAEIGNTALNGVDRLLWTGTGSVIVWSLSNSDSYVGSIGFGPYTDWTPAIYTPAPDGTARMLWSNTNGAVIIWKLDSSGNYSSSVGFGPYPGWKPVSYVFASDGTSRLMWANTAGAAIVWTLDSSGNYASSVGFGPYSAWTPTSYVLAPDGTARLLWLNTNGAVIIWKLDSSDNYSSSIGLGPYSGWTPTSYVFASDGTARLMWSSTAGAANIWMFDSSGNYSSSVGFGPYSDWMPIGYAFAANGVPKLLWSSTSGAAMLWTLDSSDNYSSAIGFGPYTGLVPQSYE